MATPLSLLYVMTALATLATLGLFLDFGDPDTNIVTGMTGAVLWGVVSVASFDVRTISTWYATKSEWLFELTFLATGLSVIVFMFTLLLIMQRVRGEIADSDIEEAVR